MKPLLSILICTIPERKEMFDALISELRKQHDKMQVQVVYNNMASLSIGEKRNRILQDADGEYVCFIDDDDKVSSDYIEKILEALKEKPDCCSLRGVITWDGENPEIFEHSLYYPDYKTNPVNSPIRYERYPNHLNVIRADIAKQFKFPETNYGEDTDWATQIRDSMLLKIEETIPGVIYHYKYKTNK